MHKLLNKINSKLSRKHGDHDHESDDALAQTSAQSHSTVNANTSASVNTATSAVSPSAPLPPKLPPASDDGSGSGNAQSSHQHYNSLSMSPAPAQPQTVPCQYRTGKTLGSGTYAIVKEAVHIKTGKYYACKVINKKLMEGREHMVRNEIHVLKKVSKGHKNIVTLHDYFETAHNLYLVFDLCTGGELFDRICAKGNYYEADAAELIRTVLKAVHYIHQAGIVHRDLKPENLIFRSKAEDADIMIADFGLSRVMDEEKLAVLTEICGTPAGHGKPVDIWAIGVITYFLLCGYTPFDRDSQQEEMQAIINRDFKFEPREYWVGVSETAKDFVNLCLTSDPTQRPTALEALEHRWLASEQPYFVPDPESPSGGPTNLLPSIQKVFNAKQTFRKAVISMMAMKRFSMHSLSSAAASQLADDVSEYKRVAEDENVDEERHVFSHAAHGEEDTSDGHPSPSSPRQPLDSRDDSLTDRTEGGGNIPYECYAPQSYTPAPFPTILFTLTFPAPLPESLPLPLAWDSHLQIVNNLRIAPPPDVHALDKSAAWVSLIDTVNFDLGTLTLTCTFIDHSKEEWPLSSPCVLLLETVISDVNRSAKEAESEAEAHSLRDHLPSTLKDRDTLAHRYRLRLQLTPIQISVQMELFSLVPLPSSRTSTPASTRPPSPNSHLSTSTSGSSLKSSTAVSLSPSQLQNEISIPPEIITPPPGVPISRYLRRRARSTLVDAFRRFVLPELGYRYRSEMVRVNPRVSLPHGGPFYALWATRSMMRSVTAEMERVLMGCGRSDSEGRDTTSSASSSPLETPTGHGDLLDDCTTTDESSVHSVVDQTGLFHANSSSSSPLPIPAKIRRKVNPMLSTEAYDFYTNLRETYARLRTLSSQLEAHVQAENRIDCVGASATTSDSSGVTTTTEGGLFEDVFDSDCGSSSSSSVRSEANERLTSAEIKSRRRAWSSRLYLVRGWETYGGNSSHRINNRDGLLGHKRSYSEPTTSTLRGGSPMSLMGLAMPVRRSPLSQTWIYEPEQFSSDDGDIGYGDVYVGSARFKSGNDFKKLGRSCEDPPFGTLSLSSSGQRRKRCVSMIAPSLRVSSSDRSTRRTKLRPKLRKMPASHLVQGYEDECDYTGVGAGSGLRICKDIDDDDEMDTGSDETDDMETWDNVDVDVREVEREAEARSNSDIVVGMERLHIRDDQPYPADLTRSYSFPGKEAPTTFPSPSPQDDTIDDHFHSHVYIPSRVSAHSRYPSTYTPSPNRASSRALKRFRYGYGSDSLRGGELDNDIGNDGDDEELYGNDSEFGYGYSRSRPTDRNKDSDDVGCGLYKKPSLEEFILPHPRSRVDSGIDVAV
ncbi:hypothetical protein Clacol_010604 [Clathrus columnatus]|uniref:Protein kinase domain-containing protein n=1 Tax=Clathrus columnatus TaxID=1419009 RepID=A0AAV5ANR4_9AGAM|nr:hypothetical protein Clacol_010604 [Clathrus columnatus]